MIRDSRECPRPVEEIVHFSQYQHAAHLGSNKILNGRIALVDDAQVVECKIHRLSLRCM